MSAIESIKDYIEMHISLLESDNLAIKIGRIKKSDDGIHMVHFVIKDMNTKDISSGYDMKGYVLIDSNTPNKARQIMRLAVDRIDSIQYRVNI